MKYKKKVFRQLRREGLNARQVHGWWKKLNVAEKVSMGQWASKGFPSNIIGMPLSVDNPDLVSSATKKLKRVF